MDRHGHILHGRRRVATLLEIQLNDEYVCTPHPALRFQPFLRFYLAPDWDGGYLSSRSVVSTLLEILQHKASYYKPQRVAYDASTLLEILPLMCLVVVGF